MKFEVTHNVRYGDEVPWWAREQLRKGDLIIKLLERLMFDQTKLAAAVARLQADDTAAIAALNALRDQNKALAAQLAAISTTDPAVQSAVDAVADQLNATATEVETGIANNPATPDLPPVAPPAQGA